MYRKCVVSLIVRDGCYLRQCDGPPTIHADAKAEERYLNLEQLGKVLQILSQILPGILIFMVRAASLFQLHKIR